MPQATPKPAVVTEDKFQEPLALRKATVKNLRTVVRSGVKTGLMIKNCPAEQPTKS